MNFPMHTIRTNIHARMKLAEMNEWQRLINMNLGNQMRLNGAPDMAMSTKRKETRARLNTSLDFSIAKSSSLALVVGYCWGGRGGRVEAGESFTAHSHVHVTMEKAWAKNSAQQPIS